MCWSSANDQCRVLLRNDLSGSHIPARNATVQGTCLHFRVRCERYECWCLAKRWNWLVELFYITVLLLSEVELTTVQLQLQADPTQWFVSWVWMSGCTCIVTVTVYVFCSVATVNGDMELAAGMSVGAESWNTMGASDTGTDATRLIAVNQTSSQFTTVPPGDDDSWNYRIESRLDCCCWCWVCFDKNKRTFFTNAAVLVSRRSTTSSFGRLTWSTPVVRPNPSTSSCPMSTCDSSCDRHVCQRWSKLAMCQKKMMQSKVNYSNPNHISFICQKDQPN